MVAALAAGDDYRPVLIAAIEALHFFYFSPRQQLLFPEMNTRARRDKSGFSTRWLARCYLPAALFWPSLAAVFEFSPTA